MPIGEIAALPADLLALLQEEAEDAAKAARSLADWLNGAIALRYGDRAAAARRAEGKDTGTVRFDDGEVTVIADLPKKVDWDQARLAPVVARIRAAGDDPDEYVDIDVPGPRAQVRRLARGIRDGFERGAHGQARQAHLQADAPRGALRAGGGAARTARSGRFPFGARSRPAARPVTTTAITGVRMALRIISADERLSAAQNKTSLAIFGPPGIGKTSLLKTLPPSTTPSASTSRPA